LHLNGSHGPLYYKRYPKEFAKFQPECKTASVNECSVESLINAYDNSILYTDYLLANAIEKLEKSGVPSVLIYISDHGESLGENGIFLHGFPYALAPKEQKEIIWSSFPLKVKPQEYNQKNVMQSVLFLLRAETKTSNKNANILE
jgi:lipid A ethanolaminephosphotransferase